jgi:tRNA 2-selenouridine synthase
MITFVDAQEFCKLSLDFPVIDVRSPGEFLQGHVAGATNIPLFSDKERARVGTLYVNAGQEQAVLQGLDFALENIDNYLRKASAVQSSGHILLHCWRGGMRSAAMAELFNHNGYQVFLLKGGYRAYRTFARSSLEQVNHIRILGGFTGSGKTLLLNTMKEQGAQVIDLEALARHKGSVFGALGQGPQPTNEQFENDLFLQWYKADWRYPIWLEDESRMIGNVTIPEPIVKKIATSPVFIVETKRQTRLDNLVREYSLFDKALLAEALQKIGQRIGGEHLRTALCAIDQGDFYSVADIALRYYDKAYLHALSRRSSMQYNVKISGKDLHADAQTISSFHMRLNLP